MRPFFCLFIVLFSFVQTSAQTVYKTPSGSKYHTSTCRYVKNVSHALDLATARANGLSPCSVCSPNSSHGNSNVRTSTSALGIKPGEVRGTSKAVQCKGKTKTGARCKRMTKNVNGYCFQHEK